LEPTMWGYASRQFEGTPEVSDGQAACSRHVGDRSRLLKRGLDALFGAPLLPQRQPAPSALSCRTHAQLPLLRNFAKRDGHVLYENLICHSCSRQASGENPAEGCEGIDVLNRLRERRAAACGRPGNAVAVDFL